MSNEQSPANDLNERVRAVYARRCSKAAGSGPLILHLTDTSLVLFHEGRRYSYSSPVTDLYDLLKQIAHAPLGLYLCYGGGFDERLEGEWRSIVATFEAVREQIAATDLPAADKKRQHDILNRLATFNSAEEEAARAIQELRPLIDSNIRLAATMRLRSLHDKVCEWADMLGPDLWTQLQVVVATSPMARQDNLTERYFRWVTNDAESEASKRRVLKVDQLKDETEGRQIVGSHLVDADAGAIFFDDRDHLHSDVLAPAFEQVIRSFTRPF